MKLSKILNGKFFRESELSKKEIRLRFFCVLFLVLFLFFIGLHGKNIIFPSIASGIIIFGFLYGINPERIEKFLHIKNE
jgi:hypothetical protein